jgi:hypothetical protein
MDLKDFISQDFTITGHGRWLRTLEHDSLVIDTQRQIFFWNSRGISGDAYVWLTRVKNLSPTEANRAFTNKEVLLFSDISTEVKKDNVVVCEDLVDVFHDNGKDNREYWHDIRGYTDETIDRFRLGFTGEWYTIPIYVDGNFRNFQCRKQYPKLMRPWYKGVGALPFNFSSLAFTSWVVLTEGPVDAIMLRQYGVPAISQTGGAGCWRSEWVTYFKNVERIHIVYDNDVAGYEGARRTGEILGTKAKIYNMWDGVAGGDVTSFFKEGKPVELFLERVENNSLYSFQLPKGGFVDLPR